jgi:DNA-binding IscR family transcriptional regulator
MQSPEISGKTGVSPAETAKVLQLLVMGGFVISRRGSKGGFQLARSPDQITTGEVVNFFLAKHPIEPAGDCPVMCALQETITPGQEAFARLTLAEIVAGHTKPSNNRAVREAGVN